MDEPLDVVAEEITEPIPLTATTDSRQPTRSSQRVHHKIKAGSILATRAATEYVYVAQDMRRIFLVAGGLTGLLFVLWLLIVVLKVIELPFY